MDCPKCRSPKVNEFSGSKIRTYYQCALCRHEWYGIHPIEDYVKERNIQDIFHFTKVENLADILRNGLIPRSELEKRWPQDHFNDPYRLDGARNASCLSIGFPNYKMFYELRERMPAASWIVISFRPDVLWKCECAFSVDNAASNKARSVPIADRLGVNALSTLFDDYAGKPTRAELEIPSYCTTNPQAEVLVFGTIPPEYLQSVYFADEPTLQNSNALTTSARFVVAPMYFSWRADYKHWK